MLPTQASEPYSLSVRVILPNSSTLPSILGNLTLRSRIWCRRSGTSSHESSLGGMASLVKGAKLPFVVLTDHRDLKYLRSAKRLNPRQARWSLFFTRFNFKVTYRPGSKNSKADTLSRQFDSSLIPPSKEPIIPSNLILAPIKWDIMTEISDQWTPSARSVNPLHQNVLLIVPMFLRAFVIVLCNGS